MFRFDFQVNNDTIEIKHASISSSETPKNTIKQSHQVSLSETHFPIDVSHELVTIAPSLSLYRRPVFDIRFALAQVDTIDNDSNDIAKIDGDEEAIRRAWKDDSDLVPNAYEGGLKTWECSLDLVSYLAQHDVTKTKRVLEIGCGSGLPGIWALVHGGALRVDFQDFNKHVLTLSTIPNVFLNNRSSENNDTMTFTDFQSLSKQSQFYSGDWSSFSLLPSLDPYDIILASEILYAPNNYPAILQVLDALLVPGGSCLIATKSYYFGCHGGGGTVAFLKTMEAYPQFTSKMVWQCPGGTDSAVTREILQITKI